MSMITLGRNEPCHCGSGKKYKKCHLPEDEVKERKALAKAAFKPLGPDAAKEGKGAAKPAAPKEDKNWLRKFAGKVGFQRSQAPRKAPSGGGG
jgi:hypothetical protein